MRDEREEEYDFAGGDEPGLLGRIRGRLSVWAGAALALALMGGVGLWGYRLSQRDAAAVPVIQAALSPAKVQPSDPGGTEIAFQDITAYRAGSAAPAPTDIVFAPPPERPSPDDVALAALAGGVDALVSDASPEVPATGDAEGAAPIATPVARPRPTDLAQRLELARKAASEEEELAARAAASAVQIQLGAYPDRARAEAMWERIFRANSDILRGRALVLQSTISGGRRFFRLRAGPFRNRIEAQNVCRALQARGQDCLVAVNG